MSGFIVAAIAFLAVSLMSAGLVGAGEKMDCKELLELSKRPSLAKVACPTDPQLYERAEQLFLSCMAANDPSKSFVPEIEALLADFGGETAFQSCVGNALAKRHSLIR
ncbi:hypothetical protein [uncultured Cohaesibacter sp.]|uniref:hypothetical protein n=1 Tax=uncultured Cohaesibacter sp. TaxID=1002546 RepID=UPI0029C76718|nr:hypothetical protein [uncultured Cohaesibacter sp.]